MVGTTNNSKINSALLGAVQKVEIKFYKKIDQKISEIHSSVVASYLPPIKVINVKEIKIDNGMALVVFISANMLKKLASSVVKKYNYFDFIKAQIKAILEKTYQKPVFIIGNVNKKYKNDNN